MSLMRMGFGLGKDGGTVPRRGCALPQWGTVPRKVEMNNELNQSPKCGDWFFLFGLGWILGEWTISGGKWLICGEKRSINLRKWTIS